MVNYEKHLSAFLTSIIFSVVLGVFIIPLLKRLKAGQNILGFVENHAGKSGTTTMGGFIFAFSAVITFLLFSNGARGVSGLAFLVSFCFLIVGFLDDFIKIKSKTNQGLTAKQKLIFYSIFLFYLYIKNNCIFVLTQDLIIYYLYVYRQHIS